jgi:hypothetical protein
LLPVAVVVVGGRMQQEDMEVGLQETMEPIVQIQEEHKWLEGH